MLNVKLPLIDEMVRTGFHRLADGGQLRYAQIDPGSTPARGTLLIAPGRREFIEKKFAEVGRKFLDRGFRLIFLEWRGQGLSSRFLSGDARQRDHIADFNTHLADLQSFYTAVIKPNQIGPLLLHGHSMGGHLMLRWQMEPGAPRADGLILTAPLLALAGQMAHSGAQMISWGAIKLGHDADYAPGQHDYDAHDKLFANNPLSHDLERFSIIEKYFLAYPDMTVGGVTWGWLHAAIKSMQIVQRRSNLAHITAPTLVMIGTKDHVTPPHENSRYLKKLPHAEIVLLQDSLHDVMNEIEPVRREAWQHIDQFLSKIMGA